MPSKDAEPVWISAAEIEKINIDVVAKSGENHFLMNVNLLESAVDRPKNLYAYEGITDIIILGSRLIEGIGKNHCFEQGNKRTAFHSGLVFMEQNDVYVEIPDTKLSADVIIDLMVGKAQINDLINLIRKWKL